MRTEKLLQRIRWLRYLLPPALVLLVVLYQLGIAESVERAYGLRVHYWIEIAFYSLSGPAVTGLTLAWIEHQLHTRRQLERALESIREEERARIGRDLHDGVAQTLYLLALRTDMLQTKNEVAPDELQHMGTTLRQCIREIRRTIFALRPFRWDEDDFPNTLHTLIEGYAREIGWEARIAGRLPEALSTSQALVVYRIVQEALNNTAKHAGATRISVHIQATDRRLRLEIADNGRGFDPKFPPHGGHGLEQMAQRAREINGRLEIHTRPGEGVRVLLELPL